MAFTPTSPKTKSVKVQVEATKTINKYKLRRMVVDFDDAGTKVAIAYQKGYDEDGTFCHCEDGDGRATATDFPAEVAAVYDEAAIWDLLAQAGDLGDGTVG